MPAWILPLMSLLSYIIMGATLGWLYKAIVIFNLFDRIKSTPLLDLLRLLICVAILFPLWNILFGYIAGDFGLTPTANQGWLVSIGVGVAIASFLFTAEKTNI